MIIKKLSIKFIFILFVLCYSFNVFADSKNYYDNLVNNWSKIFPDGNRNAAGPKFFKFIINQNLNYDEFVEYNKLYCAVSGSLINPNSEPEFVYIKDAKTNKKICGSYYRCCFPCSCDLMKYSKVKEIKQKFKDGEKKISVLTITNPCDKKDFPKEVNKHYFCNGSEIDKNQVFQVDGDLVIGLLHNASPCTQNNIRMVNNNEVTGRYCSLRNNTPLDKLQSGMGDIFIRMAK